MTTGGVYGVFSMAMYVLCEAGPVCTAIDKSHPSTYRTEPRDGSENISKKQDKEALKLWLIRLTKMTSGGQS
jgi:hypothetical protein